MSFVVIGAEWKFDGYADSEIKSCIENFLDRIADATTRGEEIWIGDGFQTQTVYENMDFWSFCGTAGEAIISADMRNELSAWLMSARYYADEELPDGMATTITIELESEDTIDDADIAWAHHRVRNGIPTGCLGLRRRGVKSSRSSLGYANLYWIHDESSHLNFWRTCFDAERDTAENLQRLSPHAFPSLFFHEDLWSGLNDLSNGYNPLKKTIRHYLTQLNDHGAWIFRAPPPSLREEDEAVNAITSNNPSNQLVEQRFSAVNLNVSPEKANVRNDQVKRSAREVVVSGRTLYCEWHGKLEPHQNRLYIHAPVPESDGKVVVAIFHKHL